MSPVKKCANAACNCVPPPGAKYCSPHCEGMGNKTELTCQCRHAECSGHV